MREQIINEIRRLAKANGGQPPGQNLFEQETGIGRHAWRGVYWARWSDALSEAGFQPNTAPSKFSEDFLFKKISEACRHFGKVPTAMEMRLYKRTHKDFPNHSTFLTHFRSIANMFQELARWANADSEYSDVAAMLSDVTSVSGEEVPVTVEGFVYLIRSGTYYKIGRSDELERRVKEIRIALPEKAILVHSIRTDDPPGIEAYWHRRFADRRTRSDAE